MRLTNTDGALALAADGYALTFASDRPYIYVDDATGARVAELFILSSVHPLHDRDDFT